MSSTNLEDSSTKKKNIQSLTTYFTPDDILNNNSVTDMSFSVPFISDETPPEKVLELVSDLDLPASTALTKTENVVNKQGEGTEIATISPSPQSHLSEEIGETTSTIVEENKMVSESYDLGKPFDLLSRKMSAVSHNGSKCDENSLQNEEANGQKNMLKVSDTHFETIDTSASSVEEVIDEIGDTKTEEKSRAVNAPEPEVKENVEYKDVSASNEPNSSCHISTKEKSSPSPTSFLEVHGQDHHKNTEADDSIETESSNRNTNELQGMQQQPRNDVPLDPKIEENNSNNAFPADLELQSTKPSSSSSTSPGKQPKKELPSASTVMKVKTNDELWKERSRSQNRNPSPKPPRHSKSRKASISKSRSPCKSPGRIAVVEVHSRKTPVGIKAKKGKYASPYQCKIFPVQKTSQRPSAIFPVDPKTHRMLDIELNRIIHREKYTLMDAVAEYYEQCEKMKCSEKSSKPSTDDLCAKSRMNPEATEENPNEDVLISRGSTRETFMSWIVKEKNREMDADGIQYFNPLANIFRKTRSTQVSGQPSFMDKEEKEVAESQNNGEEVGGINPDNKIHLVGYEQENQVRIAAQNMFQSLKLLQKVIHLSDVFCFRESLPETMTQEEESTTLLPEFHQFMESGNEIEILENVTKLLGSSKENILQYLNSLHGANLVSGKDSGLTKLSDDVKCNNDYTGMLEQVHIKPIGTVENGADIWVEVESGVDEVKLENASSHPPNQIIPLTCPSCHSQIDVEVNALPRNQILPKVHTFLEEQRKLTMCTYYNTQANKKSLIQTVMCDGLRYKIQFTTTDPCGPIQGIIQAKTEYLGNPSPLSLDVLLSTIHRCTSYIDTRIACACVWTRQSKHYLFSVLEKYLEGDNRPSTRMNRWHFSKLAKKLRRINVFSGIVSSFYSDLNDAVNMIQFCMVKSVVLLDAKLKKAALPGFVSSSTDGAMISWEEMKALGSRNGYGSTNNIGKDGDGPKIYSVESLYKNLKRTYSSNVDANFNLPEQEEEDDNISVEALMKIVSIAMLDIKSVCNFGEECFAKVKAPGKKARRVLRFMNATIAQLGYSKDVELGTLIATYFSAVEKISIFEEFMCEQKVEIRASIHRMSLKIIRKLCELQNHITMQIHWSTNLAKNSFLRIKEVNQVKRLRKLKQRRDYIEEQLSLIRVSDESLRLCVY